MKHCVRCIQQTSTPSKPFSRATVHVYVKTRHHEPCTPSANFLCKQLPCFLFFYFNFIFLLTQVYDNKMRSISMMKWDLSAHTHTHTHTHTPAHVNLALCGFHQGWVGGRDGSSTYTFSYPHLMLATGTKMGESCTVHALHPFSFSPLNQFNALSHFRDQ